MKSVYCPHCNADLEVDAKAGETVKCIDCKRPFIITKQQVKNYQKANPSLLRKTRNNIVKVLIGAGALLFLAFAAVFFQVNVLDSGNKPASQPAVVAIPKTTDQRLRENAYRVADKYLRQYEMAKAQGDKVQICVQAGLVSAAFLSAEDQEQYNKWKAIESLKCEESGIKQ